MTKKCIIENDEGFVLILSMLMLLMLTLLGMWSLNTSTTEIMIAGNQQRFNENFNMAEGAANFEATMVGFAGRSIYKIKNPTNTFNDLTDGEYDGDRMDWAEAQLVTGSSDSDTTYRYFVTYLQSGVPPKGYDATAFSSYKFRINGWKTVDIELGGEKVGPKSSM